MRTCVEALEPASGAFAGIQGPSRRAFAGAAGAPLTVWRWYAPPLRLVIIGDDPITLALGRLWTMMGREAVLVRPKGPSAGPFVGLPYLRSEPGEALAALRPDPWTGIAVLTHEEALEDAALTAALNSQAGYVGALGSRRRIEPRRARLAAAGVSAAAILRLKAPIGLDLGGKAPFDIALAVAAEASKALRPAAERPMDPAFAL